MLSVYEVNLEKYVITVIHEPEKLLLTKISFMSSLLKNISWILMKIKPRMLSASVVSG